uniref:Pre-B-cell leukemia homeobox interacting protein 1b n=1 Tax=Labrus bergylta TaxID=56723 RepID=A0A3Q3EHZ3_9LABR
STEKHAQVPAAVTESPVPTSLEVSSSSVPDSDTLSQSEDLLEGPAQTSPDPDSFSDSYTHITPSPEEPPVYLLSTETLGGVESTQEEERLTQEATVYLLNGEGLQLEGEESRTPDIGKQAEEEDEGVEEFQLPPRDDDSGFSVNKCILGAVILLGLGTIFISDSDYATRELKDEWLNPEVPSSPVDADICVRLCFIHRNIYSLVKGAVAEGVKEHLRWEEVEKENSRLKKEIASLPVLQKDNERMKRELESVVALHKELEMLRSTVTELKLSPEWKGKGEKKQWEENKNPGKERKVKDEKKQWKEKDWKNGKDDKEWKRKDESKQWENKEEKWKREGQKEKKDWKKDKSSSQMHKDELKLKNGHEEEHLWGDRKPPHSHRKTSLEHPDYWIQQKDRLQHNAKPSQHCDSLESCAGSEGLHPVPFPEFEAVLQTYLTKAEEVGVDEYKRTELKKLAAEFFKEGVFVHDQMSFQEFIEDVADILEDMVEGDEEGEEGDEEDEEDSAIEDEMEAFEKEVMKKFAVPGAGKKEELAKGEWRREGGQGRG